MSIVGDNIMKALGVFDKYGWCKGELKNAAGQYCAVGVVNQVTTGHYFAALGYPTATTSLTGDDYISRMNRPELQALAAHIPGDFDHEAACQQLYGSSSGGWVSTAWGKCAVYNNTRTSYAEIKEWFSKTALDEGISLD